MRLCYQVATPDVAVSPRVTAFQGNLEDSFRTLSEMGYDGVELMTLNPSQLDWSAVKKAADGQHLEIALVCTGEIYGQLGLSFTDPDQARRKEAIRRVCEIIDFAGFLGANINIGRVRGQYQDAVPREMTDSWAMTAFNEISRHAEGTGVRIALEPVTILQTNYINTVAEAAKVVDALKQDNFLLMMDIFHMYIEEKNYLNVIRQYQNYNIHVHLADNNRRYPGNCGMDFKAVVQAFHDAGYDGAFCTEIYQIPNQEEAARRAMRHLFPIFHEVYGRPKKGGAWTNGNS